MNIINLSLYIIIIIYFYCSYIVIYIYFFYIIMRKSAVIFIFAGFILFLNLQFRENFITLKLLILLLKLFKSIDF